MNIKIRQASLSDLEDIIEIESACFPKAEAADALSLKARLTVFPSSFLVAETDGKIIGFINGCVTNEETICDEMFSDPSYHQEDGKYQAIFGLDVLSAYRRQGVGASLMRALADVARREMRKGLILTCKKEKIKYYQSFGYENKGISKSAHGNAVWYDMIWYID